MKVKEVKEVIEKLIDHTDLVPLLLGPIGVGKSTIVREICEERGWGFIDVRLRLLSAVDVRGFPVPLKDEDRVEWLRPELLPEKGRGIVFLDEINRAGSETMNAVMQLVLDKKIGQKKLGDGWRIVAAGNRAEDDMINRMPAALRQRFIIIKVEPDVNDVIEYGAKKGWRPEVLSFLKFRSDLVYQPPKIGGDEQAPTPRGWEMVSKVLNAELREELLQEVIGGIVGTGAAVEFMAYVKQYIKWRVEEIVDEVLKTGKYDTEKVKVDEKEKNKLKIALVATLGARASSENLGNVLKFGEMLEEEMRVWLMKMLFQRGLGDEVMKKHSAVWKKFVKEIGTELTK
jgi:hypothetical protein